MIIITLNEAKQIERCLNSVSWANEIILVDSGSTDETVSIARKYTDKVVTSAWSGYGPQKNKALDLASCQWVLSIDADEVVTDELAAKIKSVLTNSSGSISGYYLARHLFFLGKRIKYTFKNDFVLRLFKRDSAKFSLDSVHERALVSGRTSYIYSPLLHYSHHTIDDLLVKLNNYSTLGAIKKKKSGRTASIPSAIFRGLWTFFRLYFLNLGFLDGARGLILSVSAAEGSYYRCIKQIYLPETTSD